MSLLIMSLVLTLSTNFMRSSFASNTSSIKNSMSLEEFQVLSSFIRKDFQYMKPIPRIDSIGENTNIVFTLQNNPTIVEFTVFDYADEGFKELSRLQYFLDRKVLVRKQFYSDQPFNQEDNLVFSLLENVTNFSIQVFDGEQWHDFWPKSPIMERSLPRALQLTLQQDNQIFQYLLPINNETIFKN